MQMYGDYCFCYFSTCTYTAQQRYIHCAKLPYCYFSQKGLCFNFEILQAPYTLNPSMTNPLLRLRKYIMTAYKLCLDYHIKYLQYDENHACFWSEWSALPWYLKPHKGSSIYYVITFRVSSDPHPPYCHQPSYFA